MYASFFGLKRAPFSIAPDPRYLFMSERHREALAHLLYGLNAGGGFVLLTGEIGAGKTTVCRCFLEQIPKRCNVGYIFNPKLTVEELLTSICDEFGVPYAPAVDGQPLTVKDCLDPLNQFLLKTHAVGQNNVLIIDEAQNLSADVLEQLRLLTNLETSERKLLQIVLIGQPELRDKLAQPGLEQMAQRVVARFHLDALSASETAQYIAHRLAVAGLAAANPFEAVAIRRIHRLTGGVPRRINLLCDRALLGGYASASPRIDRHIVDRAAAEVFDAGRQPTDGSAAGKRTRRVAAWSVAGGLLAGAALVGVATSALRVMPGPVQAATPTAAMASAASSGVRSRPAANAGGPASGTATASLALSTQLPAAAASSRAAAAASVGAAASGGAAPAERPQARPADGTIDTAALFATLPRTESEAWRALAPAWQIALGNAGDPCQAAARLQQLQCFRGNVEPALIRRLDRPGILTLRDDEGRTAYALLTGLQGQTALLRGVSAGVSGADGGGARAVPLVALARLWRGDFATFWRAPPGYAGQLANGSSGPAVDWLAVRLAGLRREPPPPAAQTFDESLRARLVAFQLAQELRPDGIAGPTTFMQINRASGVDEPRLVAATPAS